MADTIARLIFEANTAQLKKANEELKKLAKESGKAARSVDDGTKSTKKNSTETQNNTKKTQDNSKAKKKNKKETDDLSKGNKKLANTFKNAANATASLTGPLNGISGRLSFIATGLGRVGIAGVAFGAAVAGLGFSIRAAIDEFQEFESQVLKMEAMLRATGGTVGLTSQELQDLAEDIGFATLASAGDIREAQSILLTFGTITGDQFRETTALAQDLASVMGVTAQSAAKTLGKALEDPINNLSSLSRAGVVFTDTEKEIIDALINTNRQMEAQDFIIDKLTGKIGGAGEGAGKGLAGAFDGLTEQVSLLKIAFAEESGSAAFFERTAKNFTKLAKSITDALNAADAANVQSSSTSAQGKFRKFVRHINPFSSQNRTPTMTPEQSAANDAIIDSIGDETDLQMAATLTSGTVEKDKATPPPIAFADLSSTKEANERIKALDLELLQSKMNNAGAADEFHTQFREKKLADDQAAAVLEYEAALLKAEQDKIFGEERKALAMEELLAKNEMIMQNNELLEEEELRHKAKLGDINAKAALDALKFDKLTEREKTKQRIGLLKRNMQVLGQHSKAAFRIFQLASVGETVMQTQENMIKARDMYAGTPFAGVAMAVEAAVGAASIANIKNQSPTGGGGSLSSGGGSVGGAAAAQGAPVQEAANDEITQAPQAINVTVDGSIDPEGARRIIEAINEATEDGLEINALVGS
ncbi:phage tail length tape measure family protein [Schleiferiaceae bacterium]|nr:phage tail length tape measure family protein [Schleiferiaceae bacterium]